MAKLPEIPVRAFMVHDSSAENGRTIIVEAGPVDMCHRWYLTPVAARALMEAIQAALEATAEEKSE